MKKIITVDATDTSGATIRGTSIEAFGIFLINGERELFVKLNREKAFTEIYNRYWKIVFAIAYSRLKDNCLAEDILHDVFASLWANRKKSAINQRSTQIHISLF